MERVYVSGRGIEEREGTRERMKWILTLGLLLPALAAIIGVVAWAVSAEVVMGARRESLKAHPTYHSSHGGESLKFHPVKSSHQHEKKLMSDMHRLSKAGAHVSFPPAALTASSAAAGASSPTSEPLPTVDHVSPDSESVHLDDEAMLKHIRATAGAQVAAVIDRLVAQRRSASPGVKHQPQIVVVAPLTPPHGSGQSSIHYPSHHRLDSSSHTIERSASDSAPEDTRAPARKSHDDSLNMVKMTEDDAILAARSIIAARYTSGKAVKRSSDRMPSSHSSSSSAVAEEDPLVAMASGEEASPSFESASQTSSSKHSVESVKKNHYIGPMGAVSHVSQPLPTPQAQVQVSTQMQAASERMGHGPIVEQSQPQQYQQQIQNGGNSPQQYMLIPASNGQNIQPPTFIQGPNGQLLQLVSGGGNQQQLQQHQQQQQSNLYPQQQQQNGNGNNQLYIPILPPNHPHVMHANVNPHVSQHSPNNGGGQVLLAQSSSGAPLLIQPQNGFISGPQFNIQPAGGQQQQQLFHFGPPPTTAMTQLQAQILPNPARSGHDSQQIIFHHPQPHQFVGHHHHHHGAHHGGGGGGQAGARPQAISFTVNGPSPKGDEGSESDYEYEDQETAASQNSYGGGGGGGGGGGIQLGLGGGGGGGNSKGISLHFGGGPIGGGGQIITSPLGIFKTLLLPLMPRPRMNLNGKVVFGVVLEKGVGFGKGQSVPPLGSSSYVPMSAYKK